MVAARRGKGRFCKSESLTDRNPGVFREHKLSLMGGGRHKLGGYEKESEPIKSCGRGK